MHNILKRLSPLLLIITVNILFLSCEKDDRSIIENGKATVKFNFTFQNSKLSEKIANSAKYYRLPDGNVLEVKSLDGQVEHKLGQTNKTANTTTLNTNITDGIPVRIMAFDKSTDTLCADIVHVIGANDNPAMELLMGKEYKFLAMSLYSETPDVPESASTSNFMLYPGLIYANDNIKKLSEAKIRYVVAKEEDREEDKSIFPAMYPLYFYRNDDVGLIGESGNTLNVVLKQIHSQINYNLQFDPELGDDETYSYAFKLESDKLFWTQISNSDMNFSILDGSLRNAVVPPYEVGYGQNTPELFPGMIVCHTIAADNKAKLTLKFHTSLQYYYLELVNLPLRSSLRYNINFTLMPSHKVPVGVEIINLSYMDGGSSNATIIF